MSTKAFAVARRFPNLLNHTERNDHSPSSSKWGMSW
jgi:hypothetical protein